MLTPASMSEVLAAAAAAAAVLLVIAAVWAARSRSASGFEPIPGLLRGRELAPAADPRDLASFRTAAAARGPWPWPWPETFRNMTPWAAAHRSRFSDGASIHTNPRLAEELAATQYRGSYGVNSVGENVVTEQRLLDIYASQQ